MSEPEVKQPAESVPGQDLIPWCVPSLLALIEVRLQHLQKRREVLLKVLPANDPNRTKEEPSGDDGQRLSELESIQKELEELQLKQEVLQEERHGTESYHTGHSETSTGRMDMLANGQRTQPCAVAAAATLARRPAVTRCPSCQQVVSTETHSTGSWVMWTLCCLSSMLGCVAGCCLLPFFMDRLRNVHHRCPRCQTHIHTHKPL